MTEQPGDANRPDGAGPVDLDDRVDGGAPAANQRAGEHVHPGTAPSVGEGDPQAAGDGPPSTGDGLSGPGEPQGVPVPSTDAAPGTSEELPVVQGMHVPDLTD
jgi:hypothetical protein